MKDDQDTLTLDLFTLFPELREPCLTRLPLDPNEPTTERNPVSVMSATTLDQLEISREHEVIMPWGIKEPEQPSKDGFVFLPLMQVSTSTFNPRTEFPREDLEQLAESLKTYGVLEPVLVRPADTPWATRTGKQDGEFGVFLLNPDHCKFLGGSPLGSPLLDSYNGLSFAGYPHFIADGRRLRGEPPFVLDVMGNWPRYEIVAGERRFRAALIAGLTEIPCIVKHLTHAEAVEIAVTENLQRSDLSPFEEARGFELMLQLPGMTQTLMAERLNCSQTRIARIRGLLKLPEAVRDLIQREVLSPSHGQRLLPYAEFPQVCTSLALIASKQEWPAAKLDGYKLTNDVLHYLMEIKPTPVKELGYGTKFDWETICVKKCPWKAFRPKEYEGSGVCMKPDHWHELQNEAIEKQKAEQDAVSRRAVEAFHARKAIVPLPVLSNVPAAAAAPLDDDWEDLGMAGRAAQALANAAAHLIAVKSARPAAPAAPLPDLPSIRQMKYDTYRTFAQTTPPAGCSETCPCRALAMSYEGKVTEICTNPGRFDKLAADKRKEEKQARVVESSARLAEAFRVLDDALPIAPALFPSGNEPYHVRQAAAIAVRLAVTNMGDDLIRDAVKRRGMNLSPALFKDVTDKGRRGLVDALAQYSSVTLIALAAEVQLRKEARDTVEYGWATSGYADFLTGQTNKEQTE